MPELDRSASDHLNQSCYCIGTDAGAMADHLAALHQRHGFNASGHSLFSELPVFVMSEEVQTMEAIVAAVTRTVKSERWRETVLREASPIDRIQSALPVFMGFDFHLSSEGPKLIEINTNAGGGLLCAEGEKFEIRLNGINNECLIPVRSPVAARQKFLENFLQQFEARFGRKPLRVAIVDDAPTHQHLHAEFLLFKELFEEVGINAMVVDASDLQWNGAELLANGEVVDLVYNRLTDFRLEEPVHQALAHAVISRQVPVTPDPLAHALYANKRNLARLTDVDFLRSNGIPDQDSKVLVAGIPETREVLSGDSDQWWSQRNQWFFKPESGYGGKGTYRGAKLTRKVFDLILEGGYVAQAFVPPPLRGTHAEMVAGGNPLKFDIRCYVFEGHIDLVAARLYQGQTTNFRTPGGGFAPVFLVPETGPCRVDSVFTCPASVTPTP